jgi:hypothetical protein
MRTSALFIATLSILAAACDDGASNAPAAPGPDTAVGADTNQADVSDEPAPPPDVAVEEEPPYPPGPYGIEKWSIIANEGFFDPWTGETIRLSDYYGDPAVNGIVIVSAAGWCTACSYEAWDLVTVYEKYKDRGLVVLYTLYEDNRARPLWAEGSTFEEKDRDFVYMTLYRESLGHIAGLPPREANYPVLIDIGHTLSRYFDKNATPLTMIVRTSDMQIVHREVGYNAGSVDLMIKLALY